MNPEEDKVIKLQPARGKHTAQTYELQLPKVSLGIIANDPEKVVEALELVGGDITEFAKHFMGYDYKDRMKILTETMLLLNKPENAKHKTRWYSLIAAFREAKIMIAENNAFEFIASYNPNKTADNKKRNITPAQYATIANLWMKEHTNAQATKGRRKGAKPEEDNDQNDKLNGILGGMQEEDDE